MTERDIDRIVGACTRQWLDAGLSQVAIDEMRIELTSHLREAAADGRSPDDVVGGDAKAFANEWANAGRPVHEPSSRLTRSAFTTVTLLAVTSAVVATIWSNAGASGPVDETWRWVWLALALVLGLGEIFTAGFFLLPFGAGAAVAAVLAWVDAPVSAQWIAFAGASLAFLVYLQRFIRRQDERGSPPVGALRYVGQTGIVVETIDADEGTGKVRVETEEWRAIPATSTIQKGAHIRVVEVRGTRFVVEDID